MPGKQDSPGSVRYAGRARQRSRTSACSVGPYAGNAEPSAWHAPYVVLADLAQDPARIATVELHAIPGLLVLCAGVRTPLAARLAALAHGFTHGVAFDLSPSREHDGMPYERGR